MNNAAPDVGNQTAYGFYLISLIASFMISGRSAPESEVSKSELSVKRL